ncbi:MAG: hypothetical protein ABJC36_00665 [Gemmatimonadales bacterium]
MSASLTLYAVRIIHIVLGAFWVGAVVFIAAFLAPSVRAAGPAGGAVMQQLMGVRNLHLWLMSVGILTLLSGLGLYWHDSAGFQSAWLGSGPGRVFGLGGVLALLATILGMAVNAPTARRLGELSARLQGAGRPPTGEEQMTLAALQGRLGKASAAAAGLLLLATVMMAVARYVP